MTEASAAQLRVALADDHPVFRAGLASVLRAETDIAVVGEADDTPGAVRLLRERRPDVALVDLAMPGGEGFHVLARVRAEALPTRAAMVTMYDDPTLFRRALDLGARGYVLKDSAVEEVVAAVRAAAADEPYVSARLTRRGAGAGEDPLARGLDRLTPAERRVLALLVEHLTSPRIADALQVSLRTVQNHRANIVAKLGLAGPNALLEFALRHRERLVGP